MDPAAVVVPVHAHAKVAFSVPFNGTSVVFLENFHKIVGMLPPDVLDTKVVDTGSEQERPPVMFPKAWCDVALLVAVLVESFFKKILCEDAYLRATIHALLYFDVDCTLVGGQFVEVVGFDEIGREVADLHAHVFLLVHGCDEVEILQGNGAIVCILC